MSALTIYGASDDLIEIEGDIDEEFNYDARFPGDEDVKQYLAFSDGTLLTSRYDDDGIWRFGLLATGRANFSKVEGADNDHSDRVTLDLPDGEFTWVVYGSQSARKRRAA